MFYFIIKVGLMLIWNTYFSITARLIDFTSVAKRENLPGHKVKNYLLIPINLAFLFSKYVRSTFLNVFF